MNVQLDPNDLRALEDLARKTGKDPAKLLGEIVHEALADAKRNGCSGAAPGESFLDAAVRIGAVGCVKGGPRDVSSNPKYLSGFGED